jgi:hypothetical protein
VTVASPGLAYGGSQSTMHLPPCARMGGYTHPVVQQRWYGTGHHELCRAGQETLGLESHWNLWLLTARFAGLCTASQTKSIKHIPNMSILFLNCYMDISPLFTSDFNLILNMSSAGVDCVTAHRLLRVLFHHFSQVKGPSSPGQHLHL